MAVDLVRLRKLAEKASPGPWLRCEAHKGECPCLLVWSIPADCTIAHATSFEDDDSGRPADADYIAALSPDVMLEIINELEELRKRVA